MKRKGRADEALAALTATSFTAKLVAAIEARGNVETTGHDIRALAVAILPFGTLSGVQATFRWVAAEKRVEVLVKGASVPVDQQAEAQG